MSIRDFTDMHGGESNRLDWDEILSSNGYFCVTVPYSNLIHVHNWLMQNMEQKEYVWVGNNFYFTHHEDAVFFSLRWA